MCDCFFVCVFEWVCLFVCVFVCVCVYVCVHTYVIGKTRTIYMHMYDISVVVMVEGISPKARQHQDMRHLC